MLAAILCALRYRFPNFLRIHLLQAIICFAVCAIAEESSFSFRDIEQIRKQRKCKTCKKNKQVLSSIPNGLSVEMDSFHWMLQTIRKDLSNFTMSSISEKDLYNVFQTLRDSESGKDLQTLYGRIKKNTITWESRCAPVQDRKFYIFRYFDQLCKNYVLPDVDFVIAIDDGCKEEVTVPIFAFSKHEQSRNICHFPDFEILRQVIEQDDLGWIFSCREFAKKHPWQKKQAKAFFRGSATGNFDSSLPDFGNDRIRTVLFSAANPEVIDATLSCAFYSPIDDLLHKINKIIEKVPIETHFNYKYLLDIDGNASTYERCRWILLSNSVLVKVMGSWEQWYYNIMQPWVDFVPIKQDLSDLSETLHFLQENDALAKQIAENGKALGEKIFSKNAVDQYVVLLLNEYARIFRATSL